MAEKLLVEELNKTCDACPAQWEGHLDTGAYVYIRYRWGVLSFSYHNGSELETVASFRVGGEYDGTMNSSEMIKHLLPYVSFGGLG